MLLTLDFETTTKTKGHPHDPDNWVVSYSYKLDNYSPVHKRYNDPDFLSVLRDVVKKATLFVGFNIKFDLKWMWNLGVYLEPSCRYWDCSIAEHVMSGYTWAYPSLNDSLKDYGLELKEDEVADYWSKGVDTPDIPEHVLRTYNDVDVEQTYKLYWEQQHVISDVQKKLVLLKSLDAVVLAQAEADGIKWDAENAYASLEKYTQEVKTLEQELRRYLPESLTPDLEFNWDSGDQLSALLYGGKIDYAFAISSAAVYQSGTKAGLEYTKRNWFTKTVEFPGYFSPLKDTEVKKSREGKTEVKFFQVGDDILRQLKSKNAVAKNLLALLQKRAKTIKVVEMIETFFDCIESYNWKDGYIHGQFNQVVTRTGRLSSSAPNMQNTPPEVDEFLISRWDE